MNLEEFATNTLSASTIGVSGQMNTSTLESVASVARRNTAPKGLIAITIRVFACRVGKLERLAIDITPFGAPVKYAARTTSARVKQMGLLAK